MIGLLIAILLFNVVAFATNKRLTTNQIVHIWLFTTSFQTLFDTYVDLKYLGYWYFTKGIDWASILNITMLVQPVNLMFLNWYPFGTPLLKQIRYFFLWEIALLTYEVITLLPQPFGYFHYGWWNLGYSAMLNPILLLILLVYYKWVLRIEKKGYNRFKDSD